MSIQDQETFLSNIHPFEVLTPSQMSLCIQHMDIAYYPKDTILIAPEIIPEHFFIIIKGSVYEYSQENIIVMDYQNEDSFDSNSLIYGKCENTFKVNEELICYEIDKKTFLTLIEKNQEFKDFFLKDLVNKIQSLKEKEYTSQLSSFMIAKVEDTLIHEACIVDEDTELIDAIEKSMEFKTSTIIVKKTSGEYGIITDSLLKVKVLLQGRDLKIPVNSIAIFPLLTVKNDDYLFEALTILIKKNIKRVGVTNSVGEMIGILEQIDILSHFANHTYVIESKIKNAKKIEDLKVASDFLDVIKSLQAKSVKIYHISNLIGQLNTKVYQKLYSLVLPQNLQKDACLVVMGSEGRNEQIIKTDQDNAIVIKNGVDVELYRPYMQQLTAHLIELGYPVCQSKIMVSNSCWCKTYDEYKNDIISWIDFPNTKSYLYLSIFLDSFAVAGDKKLLINLKEFLYSKIKNSDLFLACFATSTINFDTPTTISSFISKDDLINIKKAAIFPIVHGIKSLTLKEKIKETTTIKRIKILEARNILESKKAAELIEAFEIAHTLRLEHHLDCIQKNSILTDEIDIKKIGKIERDLLKESFKIVNEFKKFITYTFKLNSVF